jgi:hypothetical protein
MKRTDKINRCPIDDDPPKPKGNPGALGEEIENTEPDEIEEIDKTE